MNQSLQLNTEKLWPGVVAVGTACTLGFLPVMAQVLARFFSLSGISYYDPPYPLEHFDIGGYWVRLLQEIELHPWAHPPPYLILVASMSRLPPGALILPLGLLGITGMCLAIRLATGIPKRVALLIVLLAPQTWSVILDGGDCLVIAALIISGLALAPKHHIKSGILLGLASINPAFSICVPSALIGARVAVVLGISIAISVDIMSLAAYLEPNVFFNWLHQLIHRSTATAIENTTYHSVDTIWVSFQHHIAGLQSGSEGTALIITSVGAFLLVATAFRRSTKRSDRALAIFVAMAMTPVLTPFMPAINFVAPIQITALALLYLYPGWKVAAVQMKRLFFLILAILVLPGFLLLFSSPLVSQAVILASCSIVGIFAALGIQRNPLAGLTDVYDEENIGDGSTPISLDDVINRENVKQEWMRARYWR